MATNYTQIGYGSRGSDVKKLQEQLNSNGYKLDVDGVFGPKTQDAVRDYQKKNNLTIDGIVGQETWGAIEKQQSYYTTNSEGGEQVTDAPETDGATAADDVAESIGSAASGYQEGDAVREAYDMLQEHMGSRPGEYQSAWADQVQAILDQIMNRDKFSYDLNGDALYQQYKDQYMMQGQQAMMDTMGQAAAMTGGYGNSYAQTAGQQAYQGYLQRLNDVVPELYGMALDQYNQEGQNMLDQYALLAAQDEQDYGRYRDSVSDYYSQLQQLYDQYNDERSYDYGKWADERDFAYSQERDQVADDQWQAEFDEDKRRYDQAWEEEYGSGSGSSGGGSGGSGGGSGGGGSYNAETAKIQQMLKDAGYNIAVDGIWGPKTQAAYDDYYGGDDGGTEYTDENGASKLSPSAQAFVNSLPYPGGGHSDGWKDMVKERLDSSSLSGEDKIAISVMLGIRWEE